MRPLAERHRLRRPRPVHRAASSSRSQRTDGSGTDSITADRIVIAAGSRPVVPPAIGGRGRAVPDVRHGHAHRRAARAPGDRRRRLHRRRVRARVLRARLPGLDHRPERAAAPRRRTRRSRSGSPSWPGDAGTCISARKVAGAHAAPRGDVAVELTDGTSVRGDLLLVATGRVPNGDRLDLPAAGLPTHPDGRIVVDDQQRTPVDGIFALGDVSSEYQLKHVANHEARVVAHNLLHPDAPRSSDHRFVPSAVFTDPQIAAVGRTEAQCRDDGTRRGRDRCRTTATSPTAGRWRTPPASARCSPSAAPAGSSARTSSGPRPSTVIQPLIQAMSFGLDARDDGLRAVLDPPGAARSGRERAARAGPIGHSTRSVGSCPPVDW